MYYWEGQQRAEQKTALSGKVEKEVRKPWGRHPFSRQPRYWRQWHRARKPSISYIHGLILANVWWCLSQINRAATGEDKKIMNSLSIPQRSHHFVPLGKKSKIKIKSRQKQRHQPYTCWMNLQDSAFVEQIGELFLSVPFSTSFGVNLCWEDNPQPCSILTVVP